MYNLPQSTGTEITPALMADIQKAVPQLQGVKHSAPTFGSTKSFVEMGLDVFAGDRCSCWWLVPSALNAALVA